MMLKEQTQVPDAALPVQELRDHLQLGSGFADDGLQDPVLRTCLRAAMAAVENDTGKALLARRFEYVLSVWSDFARQALPVAPVVSVVSLTITDLLGASVTADPAQYRLQQDFYTPAIVSRGWSLPLIPDGGTASILFDAGFGSDWANVPADVAQAVLILAAHFYDHRSAMTDKGRELPAGISSLLRRYRPIRLTGGR